MTRSLARVVRSSLSALGFLLCSASLDGWAQVPAAPADTSVPAAPLTATTTTTSSAPPSVCQEHIPEGKARPLLKDSFPSKGVSGHHVTLEVEIEHGVGETVLPGALQVQRQTDAAKRIEQSGFIFPDHKGPGRPRITRTESGSTAKTKLLFPLLALPKKPGRNELVLPALPIAMSRASGEVITLCTSPHTISIEDPTANAPNAQPKSNPKPLRQREFWVAARNAAYGGVAALVMAALGYLAVSWWRRRPKPAPPPIPKRPPWDIALEAFFDIRQARLIEQGRLEDHIDRVSNTLRQYVGDRFGFDGLESTTYEITQHLKSKPEAQAFIAEVEACLVEADLVKFADMAPTEAQCHGVLERSEQFVRRSIPMLTTAPADGELSVPASVSGGGE